MITRMKLSSSLRAVLTASEAATKYGLTSQHIRHLAKEKLIHGRSANGVWLIDENSLRRYLAAKPKPGRKPRK